MSSRVYCSPVFPKIQLFFIISLIVGFSFETNATYKCVMLFNSLWLQREGPPKPEFKVWRKLIDSGLLDLDDGYRPQALGKTLDALWEQLTLLELALQKDLQKTTLARAFGNRFLNTNQKLKDFQKEVIERRELIELLVLTLDVVENTDIQNETKKALMNIQITLTIREIRSWINLHTKNDFHPRKLSAYGSSTKIAIHKINNSYRPYNSKPGIGNYIFKSRDTDYFLLKLRTIYSFLKTITVQRYGVDVPLYEAENIARMSPVETRLYQTILPYVRGELRRKVKVANQQEKSYLQFYNESDLAVQSFLNIINEFNRHKSVASELFASLVVDLKLDSVAELTGITDGHTTTVADARIVYNDIILGQMQTLRRRIVPIFNALESKTENLKLLEMYRSLLLVLSIELNLYKDQVNRLHGGG